MTKKKKKILNAGFVQLLDVMGGDRTVLESARVSTGAKSDPAKDKKLIQYLMANKHETPFESIVFRFHVKLPIFVMRQWIRHRIASYNEYSQRYRKAIKDYYVTNNLSTYDKLLYETMMDECWRVYEKLMKTTETLGTIPERRRIRETARAVLPTAFYTEFYWTINFRSLMNFLSLRLDEAAQWEIRQYAIEIKSLIFPHIPVTMGAFLKTLPAGAKNAEKKGSK